VDAIPPEVLQAGRNVSVAIDIMFVNKLPFFITLSREIKFGTVESIPNRQVATIRNCLEKVVRLYKNRGFTVSSILADSEFEPIWPWFPTLNTATADEHVLEIEQYICTMKEGHTQCSLIVTYPKSCSYTW
jgi:hypothetical protein